MYKYTAKPEVLKTYASITESARRPWDDHFYLALSIVGSSDAYFACGDFWRHYQACQFYSKERVRQVPINGVLISVDWFQETKV